LGKIDHLTVQGWIADLSTRPSPATVAECYRLMSVVLKTAVRDRILGGNPCDASRSPAAARRRPINRSSDEKRWLDSSFRQFRTGTGPWSV
jgi:hypothetical protein